MAPFVRTPCDAGVILGGRHGRDTSAAGRWVLVVAVLGSSLAFIDGTMVTVALPAIASELSATARGMQWVVEAYTLVLSALVLVGGSLGDRWGRAYTFAAGVALFAAASAGCGFAPTINALIWLRAVQGLGAALLVPGSLALISEAFPEDERGKAIGTWSAFSGVAAAVGPVVGGWFVEHQSWRWAFFINLPIAAVVLAMLWSRTLAGFRRPPATSERRVDWAGAALASLGLGGVVYALVEASERGWGDAGIQAALTGGLLSLLLLVLVERRAAAPMLPLELFRSANFSGANLLTFLLYAALGGALFFLPIYLIQVRGYSATAGGAALLPFIAIMFALSRWAGGLVSTYGPTRPLVVGPIIAAAGFAAIAAPGLEGPYWSSLLPGIAVLGVGMATTVAPLTTTVMSSVPDSRSGLASGVNNAVARTAGAVAVAAFSLLVGIVFTSQLRDRLEARTLSPEVRSTMLAEAAKWAGAEIPDLADARARASLRRDVDESFLAAFRLVMVVSAGLALASAGSALALVRSEPKRR